MCNWRTLNNNINTLHKRCLPIIHNDELLKFQQLHDKNKSVSIQGRNKQPLPTGMFKVSEGLVPDIFASIFKGHVRYKTIFCYKVAFDL